ncbi:Asp-tRNA(Asn)/Glu-tRNA(Gln) amidotransferase subunit GatB [Candidatus Jorgensenbacteria bacterium CG_4_8_14_3_um_filter_38_10]|nr:MAG: Asp-tRNA(Asn)/Glu-tRNA(Gln) amidotransferase subunit GatB [Candidatus Jorgensenbacteria bacterium CG03_land_8_20_14_0_80_38_39]PIW97438.1 MAG: Asp-tRNA(Asn)/Glu-tRNA(Gln) amidotransferase subunit GatB [Candidatus Jorgensenbacteria bacterium CG_4_8_14_3_um_filter_38_10]
MYQPTIGLEIHAELKTKTKMFCGCLNDPDEKHPNINICPICLGHPGTLPTINQEAVEAVLKLGLALNSIISKISKFDRKSYFYPDLPKGYQISQYEEPLVRGGKLKGIRIRRIHLEEDTGRLLHADDGQFSLVDFNRAGVPLMELVTEPDIKNSEEAVEFAKEFQQICRYLKISDADMEKGEMRVEVNISLREIADQRRLDTQINADNIRENQRNHLRESAFWGTKVEIKNLNSFKVVEESIDYEIKRQSEILEKGEMVKQETRGWDDNKKKTVSQRSKEEAQDYRYFPEPDLPPLNIPAIFNLKKMKQELPELPEAKRRRFNKNYGFDKKSVEILVEDKMLADYFEEATSELKAFNPQTNYQLLLNYFTSDLRGLMKEKNISLESLKIKPEHFAHLVYLAEKGNLSSRLIKDLLAKMAETGEDPETLIKEQKIGLINDDDQLLAVIKRIIQENKKAVEDYKKGKENALQFLIGQAMEKTRGQGKPDKLKTLFKKELS